MVRILGFALALLMPAAAFAAPGILVVGDSLSAAYGISRSQGWVALLEKRLKRERLDYNVVNASISGETTRGGVVRFEKLLARHRPAVVVLALGSNDGLRGLPVPAMKRNLNEMIEAAQKARARVLVIGARIPPNYGPDYSRDFDGAFAEVARARGAGLVPFLLDGIADKPESFQYDGLHPTAEAQPRLLENVWAGLAPLLRAPAAR